jgi:hypothetical protein
MKQKRSFIIVQVRSNAVGIIESDMFEEYFCEKARTQNNRMIHEGSRKRLLSPYTVRETRIFRNP